MWQGRSNVANCELGSCECACCPVFDVSSAGGSVVDNSQLLKHISCGGSKEIVSRTAYLQEQIYTINTSCRPVTAELPQLGVYRGMSSSSFLEQIYSPNDAMITDDNTLTSHHSHSSGNCTESSR